MERLALRIGVKTSPAVYGLVAATLLALAAGCSNPAGEQSASAQRLPDFGITATTPSPIQAGSAGGLSVSVQRDEGHSGALTLSVDTNGQGVTGTGTIPDGIAGGSITLTVPSSTPIGTYALTVSGTDGTLTHTATFDLSVIAALIINTTSPLAVASVGAAYPVGLGASGGTPPYAWAVTGGALPSGLTLDSGGALSGMPSGSGSFDFTVQATDAANVAVTKSLSLLVTDALLPALLSNGSFEQGLTGWSPLGSGSGVQYAIVTDSMEGGSAVRVTSRSLLSHAPGGSVFSGALANANGTPVTTRFWVKLDAPGIARLQINLTSTTGGSPATVKLILAEQVVRTANVWVEVSGTNTLAWNGTLTAAVLEFNIGQPIELVYSGFTLDDVRIQRDADADGVPDADEAGADANNPDRDFDSLPDGWELRYATAGRLDPEVADAGLDADADGTSNGEEYWAATDPLDPASTLGVPVVAAASTDVRSITVYLSRLPSRTDTRVVSGQHITGAPSQGGVAGEFDTNVQALFDQTGKWPGLLSMQYEGADSTIGPLQVSAVNPIAIDWAAAGGLVLIKYQPFDPWTLAQSSPSGGAHVDLVGLLDPAAGNQANLAVNQTANARWLDWLDQTADGLDELQQAGIVVLWRPLSEMNNGTHWHSRQPRDAWIALWRHMFDYFTTTRGLNNLIWVYESDGGAHPVTPADYYYPGDDVVDLMGHNLYDDDWAFPYDLNALFRQYPKIYGFPQAGSASIRDGTWDNRTIILGIQQRFPRASLFCTWNDFYASGNTFYTRSMVSQTNAAGLLSDPWVITRDEVSW